MALDSKIENKSSGQSFKFSVGDIVNWHGKCCRVLSQIRDISNGQNSYLLVGESVKPGSSWKRFAIESNMVAIEIAPGSE